ncbi:MAG: adenylate/guanylate cyclase domain-containing protein [Hyphomicrobiales bacterium]|nr:adenylate/guanylate cyclase domain-containing protein [Hyphomicrobiales bacterium]
MRNVISLLARSLASRGTIGLLLLVALLGIRVWDPPPLEELRLRSFDLYQRMSPRAAEVRPVVIVDIDEASIAAFGQWPWPRTVLADLLDRLKDQGAAAIAFDVIFAEPDRSSPSEAIKHFRGIDDAERNVLSRLPSHDAVFAESIARSRVVLGQSGANTIGTDAIKNLPETGFASVGPDPRSLLVSFPHVLRNLPTLERAAAGRGLVSIRPERDGMVRRVPLVMQAEGKTYPALTLDLLRVVAGAQAILIRSDQAGVRTVAVPGLELPTDQNGRVWVHFGPHDPGRYVSARDVIERRVAPDAFDGKLVLVGPSAIGLLDVKTTPLDAAMPGVEIHAQVLEAALTDALLASPNYAIAIEIVATLIVGVAIALVAPHATALALFVSALAVMAAFAATSWIMFSRYQILIDATFPVLAIFSVYASLVLIGYFREQLDRRRIRQAFAQYLSPNLVEQLASSPDKLVLGGEKRNMTVLFTDVRGFTTISETYKDDPQGLTTLMNRFLTPLTNVIVAHRGTIDKYMGDAIMAFWNAPLEDPLHEVNACRAALEMLERVDDLNRVREQEAKAGGHAFVPIRMGIGINTGPCAVGNMGSDLRFQYTVMGDSVNLASRLEGQTKTYGVPVIIGSRTAQAAGREFALLAIDSIRVRGKTEPEETYALLGGADVAASEEFVSLQKWWSELRECGARQDWANASLALERSAPACRTFGIESLIEIYAERIRGHRGYGSADDAAETMQAAQ